MIRYTNHSGSETNGRAPGGAVWWAVALANSAAVLASCGSLAAASVDPGLLLPAGTESTPAAEFYARYALARTLPLSAMVVALVLARSASWLGALLIAAGLIQAADALIGAAYHDPGQTLAPAAAAAVHLASARWMLLGRGRPWRG